MQQWLKTCFSMKAVCRPFSYISARRIKNFLFQISRKLAYGLVSAAIAAGIATYIAFTNTQQTEASSQYVLILINVDLVLLLLLAVLVINKLVDLGTARRRGLAGSRLHSKLVLFFSLLAVTPAIIVAIFSVLFFNFGLQTWFSERVDIALNNSLAVAEAYLKEHQKLIRADAASIAYELSQQFPALMSNRALFNKRLSELANFRNVSEAIVFTKDSSHQILARSALAFTLEFEIISQADVDQASRGKIVVLTNKNGDRVRSLALVDRATRTYLYIGRLVDPHVLNHRQQTMTAVSEYNLLKGKQSQFEIRFALIFALVALLLLLVAVWIGLTFATQLSRPIRRLMIAAEKLRLGDLAARVEEEGGEEELASLSRAFNRMANQLENQRKELVEANYMLDLRRQFTETILEGVSAGVIGLDEAGRIYLPNHSANELLKIDLTKHIGTSLSTVVPEMAGLIEQVRLGKEHIHEAQITLPRPEGAQTLFVRIVVEKDAQGVVGFIVTFDDMTELLAAQRKAAWSDVARRIAHEIKNPLTPIQLSAERLQRKYLKEIKSNPEVFQACTETIVRQVEDIGRMVDEFSAFARMPQPVMAEEDLGDICAHALFLQKNAHSGLQFTFHNASGRVLRQVCDRRLITQAVTNLLLNSIDAVYGRLAGEPETRGKIGLTVEDDGKRNKIIVEDNGCGLPTELIARLTEPYVTTKDKGTGLGLAIVKKIMEDHQGMIALFNRSNMAGARIELIFDYKEKA